jgi:hypothetical protein
LVIHTKNTNIINDRVNPLAFALALAFAFAKIKKQATIGLHINIFCCLQSF